MLDIMDTYGASISVLIIAIMEMTFIMWGYGVNNFCKDVHAMLDFTPSIYFKVFIHTTYNAIDCFSFPGMLGFFLASNPCRYFHCCSSKLAETQLWRSPISRCTVLSSTIHRHSVSFVVDLLLRLVARDWVGSHLALPGPDPDVDGGHHCCCCHTG